LKANLGSATNTQPTGASFLPGAPIESKPADKQPEQPKPATSGSLFPSSLSAALPGSDLFGGQKKDEAKKNEAPVKPSPLGGFSTDGIASKINFGVEASKPDS
jgi:hypothetical protein